MTARLRMALRRTTGFAARLPRRVSQDWSVPGVTTLSRHLKTLKEAIPCRGSGGPLQLRMGGTGIKVEGGKACGPTGRQAAGATVCPKTAQTWRHMAAQGGASGARSTSEPRRTRRKRVAGFANSEVGGMPMLPEQHPRSCRPARPPSKTALQDRPALEARQARPRHANEALCASGCFGRTVWRRWRGHRIVAASERGCIDESRRARV